MSWRKIAWTIRTSATSGLAPKYDGMGDDAGYWQGKFHGTQWVITAHENIGVQYRFDSTSTLALKVCEAGDYWTDGIWYLYNVPGYLCLSQHYGVRPTNAAGIDVWTIDNLPAEGASVTASLIDSDVTHSLAWHWPRWTSDVQFGQYTGTGGASGSKTFGSPNWVQSADDTRPGTLYRAVALDASDHHRYRPGPDGGPNLQYHAAPAAWVLGAFPASGTYYRVDSDPVPGSDFTLVEYTRVDDGQGGHTDTPTGSTITYTADGYGQCPGDKTKILLVTPEIVT